MAHSHPRLTRGGAEISAYALFRALRETPGTRAWFMAVASQPSSSRLGASLTQPFGPDDFVYTPQAAFDYFKFANRDPDFPRTISQLVSELRPDVVHAHHYLQFGVEIFSIIKRAHPASKIVLSLHEFLAICLNHGQMVKTGSFRLCDTETPSDCARCFSERAPRDFFLRKNYIQMFLDDVDLFVSPSRFLAERYIAWGLPAEKLVVLENMPPSAGGPSTPSPVDGNGEAATPPATDLLRDADRIHVGVFGQMSPLKGIPLVVEAARQLHAAGVENLMIDLHGDYSNQPADFKLAVTEALEAAGENVAYHGAYDNSRVHHLMRSVDAVLVPSIWWENSPVVIQEAYSNGKPVICANIGGMAEKVRPGLDGFHLEAGQASSLAQLLLRVSRNPAMLTDLTPTLQRPLLPAQAVQAHLALYQATGEGAVGAKARGGR